MQESKTQETPRFSLHRAARPMLARDADAMYWMSRYIERAEHVARLLLINSNLLIDVGDLAPSLQQRQWHSVLQVMRMEIPDDLLAPQPGRNGEPAHGHHGGDIGAGVARYMTFRA